MQTKLLDEIQSFLADLDQTQEELLALFAVKSRALKEFQGETLVRLSQQETDLAHRLEGLLGRRKGILERARQAGLPADSLQKLAGAIGNDDRSGLDQRIAQAQDRAARLRHESWVHWIISHRCYNHYTEMLDLIAHGGKRAATYGGQAQTAAVTSRGALLDASI